MSKERFAFVQRIWDYIQDSAAKLDSKKKENMNAACMVCCHDEIIQDIDLESWKGRHEHADSEYLLQDEQMFGGILRRVTSIPRDEEKREILLSTLANSSSAGSNLQKGQ